MRPCSPARADGSIERSKPTSGLSLWVMITRAFLRPSWWCAEERRLQSSPVQPSSRYSLVSALRAASEGWRRPAPRRAAARPVPVVHGGKIGSSRTNPEQFSGRPFRSASSLSTSVSRSLPRLPSSSALMKADAAGRPGEGSGRAGKLHRPVKPTFTRTSGHGCSVYPPAAGGPICTRTAPFPARRIVSTRTRANVSFLEKERTPAARRGWACGCLADARRPCW